MSVSSIAWFTLGIDGFCSLEHALQKDTSNLSCLNFLDRVEEWLKHQDPIDSHATEWVSIWRRKLLESLKPFKKDDTEYLVDLSLKVGGVEFLERTQVSLFTALLV